MNNEKKLFAALVAAGFTVGLAKMLTSNDPITSKQALDRPVLSGATGLAAGVVAVFVPGVSFVAQVAFACVLASLGTSAIESLLKRVVDR